MKNIVYIFVLFVLLGCDNSEGPEVIICPGETSMVFALTVDYITNEFLGGYTVDMPFPDYTLSGHSLTMTCEYKAPGDFGSVKWYDKQSMKELFAGTIIWMGKGERTFPEKISPPSSFPKLDITTVMPPMTTLLHDEFVEVDEDIDYTAVWKAVSNLQCVSWMSDSTPAYIYLYAPSVGIGDPKDWYWVIFLKY